MSRLNTVGPLVEQVRARQNLRAAQAAVQQAEQPDDAALRERRADIRRDMLLLSAMGAAILNASGVPTEKVYRSPRLASEPQEDASAADEAAGSQLLGVGWVALRSGPYGLLIHSDGRLSQLLFDTRFTASMTYSRDPSQDERPVWNLQPGHERRRFSDGPNDLTGRAEPHIGAWADEAVVGNLLRYFDRIGALDAVLDRAEGPIEIV